MSTTAEFRVGDPHVEPVALDTCPTELTPEEIAEAYRVAKAGVDPADWENFSWDQPIVPLDEVWTAVTSRKASGS